MNIKTRAMAVTVVALLFGMLAIPASAQTDEDPDIADAEDCLIAVLVSDFNFLPSDQFPEPSTDESGLVDQDAYLDENPGIVDSFLAYLGPDGIDVDFDEVCEIGGSYVPLVEGEIVVDPPEPQEEVITPIRRPVDPPAPQVLGRVLAVTGGDAAIIALFGVALLGLGVVAVRGTRRRADEA